MDIEGYRAHAEANHAIAKKLGAWVDVLLKENAELKARLVEAEAKERSHALIAEQLENAIDCMATAEAEAARLRSALEPLTQLLIDIAQIFDGWHADGTAWTEWDESVRRRITAALRPEQPEPQGGISRRVPEAERSI